MSQRSSACVIAAQRGWVTLAVGLPALVTPAKRGLIEAAPG